MIGAILKVIIQLNVIFEKKQKHTTTLKVYRETIWDDRFLFYNTMNCLILSNFETGNWVLNA